MKWCGGWGVLFLCFFCSGIVLCLLVLRFVVISVVVRKSRLLIRLLFRFCWWSCMLNCVMCSVFCWLVLCVVMVNGCWVWMVVLLVIVILLYRYWC